MVSGAGAWKCRGSREGDRGAAGPMVSRAGAWKCRHDGGAGVSDDLPPGTVFDILSREYPSICTGKWLFRFGPIFVSFVLFARQGPVGIGAQIRQRLLPGSTTGAAMAGRRENRRPLPATIPGRDSGGRRCAGCRPDLEAVRFAEGAARRVDAGRLIRPAHRKPPSCPKGESRSGPEAGVRQRPVKPVRADIDALDQLWPHLGDFILHRRRQSGGGC